MADDMKLNNRLLTGLIAALTLAVVVQSAFLYRVYAQMDEAISSPSSAESETLIASAKPGASDKPIPLSRPQQRLHDPMSFFSDEWDPFAELERMRNEMSLIFDDSFGRFGMSAYLTNRWQALSFNPSLDLREEKDRYVVRMDVPGVDKSQLSAQLSDRLLTISGRIEESSEKSDGKELLHRERRSGQFQRSITLPGPVKSDGMEADYQNGVLTVTVPKAEESKESTSITIK